MELRYCEECGDVIRMESSAPESLDDHFVCPRCKGGSGVPKAGPNAKPAHGAEQLESDNLNLFSPRTIAIHRSKIEAMQDAATGGGSSRLRLVKEPTASLATPASGQLLMANSGEGALSASRSAQKILFRCLHCRATLSIRPVEKTSRLVCPHCSKEIYVTPDGRLLKNSPSSAIPKPGSSAVRKPAEPGPGEKAGSTFTLKSHSPPSGGIKVPAGGPARATASGRDARKDPTASVRLLKENPRP